MPDLIIKDGKTRVVDPVSGMVADVEPERAAALVRGGYVPEGAEEFQARIEAERYDSPARAFAAGLARGATLGASDLILPYMGVSPEELAKYREYSPGWSTAGDVGGNVLSVLLPGGPIGLAGRGAAKVAGEAGRVAATVARSTAEGALAGLGAGVSDVALGERQDVLNALVSDAAMGALAGGLLGAGAEAVGAGVRAVGRATKPMRESLAAKIKGLGSQRAEREALEAQIEALGKEAGDLGVANARHQEEVVFANQAIQDAQNAKAVYVKANADLRASVSPDRNAAAIAKKYRGFLKQQLPQEDEGVLAIKERTKTKIKRKSALAKELDELTPEERALAREEIKRTYGAEGAYKSKLEGILPEINANDAEITRLQGVIEELRSGKLYPAEKAFKASGGAWTTAQRKLDVLQRQAARLQSQQSPLARFLGDAVGARVRQLVGFSLGGVPGAIAGDLIGPAISSAAKNAVEPLGAVTKAVARGAKAATSAIGRTAPAALAANLPDMNEEEYAQFARDVHAIDSADVEVIGRTEHAQEQPELVARATAATQAGIDLLKQATASAAAHDPIATGAPYRPSLDERVRASRLSRYLVDPTLALEEFRAGHGTPEGRDYIERALPEVIAKERQYLDIELRKLAKQGRTLPMAIAEQVALLRGAPAPGLKSPDTVAVLQELYSSRKPQKQNVVIKSPPKNYNVNKKTEYQRLLESAV
jgi:hypothetical protein